MPDKKEEKISWKEAMKNILVTGGCGFIGSHIVDFLIKKKSKLVITVYDLIHEILSNIIQCHIIYSFPLVNQIPQMDNSFDFSLL